MKKRYFKKYVDENGNEVSETVYRASLTEPEESKRPGVKGRLVECYEAMGLSTEVALIAAGYEEALDINGLDASLVDLKF